jgi:hypothetical protein
MPSNHQMFSKTKSAIESFLLSIFASCQTFSKPKPMVEILYYQCLAIIRHLRKQSRVVENLLMTTFKVL